MGCKLGKGKYKPLPVDEPSKVHHDSAPLQDKATGSSMPRQVPPAGSSAASRPAPKNLMEAFGLEPLGEEEGDHKEPGVVEALNKAMTGFVAAVTDGQGSHRGYDQLSQGMGSQALLHDADDHRQGIFSDFAKGAPHELLRAGQSHVKVSGSGTGDSRRSSDSRRLVDYISSIKYSGDDSVVMQGIGFCVRWCIKPLLLVAMAYIWVGRKAYSVYLLMPTNVVQMIFGLGLCLFGGVYFTAIAAVEAAVNLGGADMVAHLKICWEEGTRIAAASRQDDALDEDHDGVADVMQLSYQDLAARKAKVAMVAVTQPERLQQAVISLVNVYIAVLATLKFQFAKTVAVALGIANMLTLPACRLAAPLLVPVMGKDLSHWIPAIIDTSIKILAVWVATWIQSVISSFYSALRGGRLFAAGLVNICSERGWMDMLPDFVTSKPFNPDESVVDEGIAYPVAALGFYLQVSAGFSVVFPLNLVLLPLTFIEYVLRFQVYT